MNELKTMGWVLGSLLCLSVLFSDGCYELQPTEAPYVWKMNKFTGDLKVCSGSAIAADCWKVQE